MVSEVHSVRFYNLDPISVKCMSCNEDSKKLAVARGDNTIEIWNLLYTPFIERCIIGSYDSIETLGWFNDRLFSGGLQGSIIEYDLLLQAAKSMHPVTSGTCWCIAIKEGTKQLAAGTESGYINIFDINDDEIVYKKILDKQEGRITCIAWDSTGKFIVTGSVDTVRIWSVESGLAVHRMTTGRSQNNKETVVWSLVVTSDFNIISGDSRGKLCFWDGNIGLGITSYQSHKADIRAVCLSGDQNTVYCAGTDPLIATYERVKVREGDEKGKWVKSIQRCLHDHDVSSLVICDNKLFSAGIDGYIALSCYPPKVLFKYPPLLQTPAAHTSGSKRLLLLRYPSYLELWRLGKKNESRLSQLLHWEPPYDARVKCSALSSNGAWMACSTQDRFRLYSLRIEDNKARLSRIKITHKKSLISTAMCFSPDSSKLILGTQDCSLVTIDLTPEEPVVATSSDTYKNGDMKDSIRFLAVSSDSEYVISSDLVSNIVVWQQDKVYARLPKYLCPVTALAVNPSTDELVIVYADHKIMEYSLNKRKYTKFSKVLQDQLPKQWLSRSFPVQSITFDERNHNIIILHDDNMIFIINKEKEFPEIEAKIPRLGPYIEENSSENSNQHPFSRSPQHAFHVFKKYKHLVYFGALCKGEMVAIEVSPVKLAEKLPPTLKQKRFGRM